MLRWGRFVLIGIILVIGAFMLFQKGEERSGVLKAIQAGSSTTEGKVASVSTSKRNVTFTVTYTVSGKAYSIEEVRGKDDTEADQQMKSPTVTYATADPSKATVDVKDLEDKAGASRPGALFLGLFGILSCVYGGFLATKMRPALND